MGREEVRSFYSSHFIGRWPADTTVIPVSRTVGTDRVVDHIYWDQASLLVQIGLLDPQTLPVVGVEQARKILDPTYETNLLIRRARNE